METFDSNKTSNTFYQCSSFLLANSEQIKRICNLTDDYFWNKIAIPYDNYYPEPFLSQYEFTALLRYNPFNDYIKQIKHNRMKKINVLYDETVFNAFIETYGYKEIQTYVCFAFLCHYSNLKIESYPKGVHRNSITTFVMQLDHEFAYTHFYHLELFKKFALFVKHKQNYEQRHNRLAMVHEKMFDRYDNGYNSIEMVLCNDYLIQIVLRFL